MGQFPRICPKCSKIIPARAECACQRAAKRQRDRRHDQTRPTASQRGYNSKWRTASKAFLRRFPMCAMCHGEATQVDHIKPHKGDRALFWDQTNWQPLCTTCHAKHKQRQERAST